jgi:hypothetical protein
MALVGAQPDGARAVSGDGFATLRQSANSSG